MQATELPINDFLQKQNVQFIIPVYQRNYDWTTNECNQLLNDIISVEKDNRGTHFIGSIVFIQDGIYSTNNVKELVIIDGQQRLTTINILYIALYRFAKENEMIDDAQMLFNLYIANQYAKEENYKYKLKQTGKNAIAFKALINSTESQFQTYSNVIENYIFFIDQINEANFQTILNGIKRLIFVEVSLERGKDDPQRIFESLNSTGLDLSQSDLIRNFILMDLETNEQTRVFEQIWNPIEENARDITRQKSMVSEYIRDYLTLKNKKIPNKGKVYQEFKKLYENKKDEFYHQDLEKIKSLSAHYSKLINPINEKNSILRQELEYLNRLEINVAFPFLLQVFEDTDNGIISEETLIQILKLIQVFVWRRFIVGLPTNALNKIFMTLYSEVDTENYYESIAFALIKKKGSGKFPTDQEFISSLKDKDLYNIQAKNRNYMFELLENHNNREFVDTSNEKITVEHIFPRNPNEDWTTDLSSEDFFIFKEKHLNTIANLTLSGNNGALSNKSFSEKQIMNIEEGEQGYKYSRLRLNVFLNEINSWNVENYEKRFSLISERFLSIWGFPKVEIPILEERLEQTIFEAEKPTHKKLDYFIFEDERIDGNAISQMYFHVVKQLLKKNSELLLSKQEMIKITRDKNDFRSPQLIDNGYYIEANLDSNSKFNILKKTLTLFELEEELKIKYSSKESNENELSRFVVRRNYWKQILPLITGTELFQNVNPSKDHWLSTGAGISGISYTIVITRAYIRLEFTISTSSKELNKKYYHQLFKNKNEIESRFENPFIWEELPENKMCRIKYELENVNLFEKEYWEEMNQFVINNLPKFEKAFSSEIKNLKKL